MIERRTQDWGVAAKVTDCTPHRFRHTFATALVDKGVDVRIIQVLMDHADLNTTQLYTKVADVQAFEAMLPLPRYEAGDGCDKTGVTGPGSAP